MQNLFQKLWEIEYKILSFEFYFRWDKKEFMDLVKEKERLLKEIERVETKKL